MNILIIDDESTIRRALCLGLQKRGHQLSEAEHPAEALKKIQEEVYDLVILDYNLSILSGLDLLKVLKNNKRNLQVVLLTSHKLPIENLVELDIQSDNILSKDEPINKIINKIESKISINVNH